MEIFREFLEHLEEHHSRTSEPMDKDQQWLSLLSIAWLWEMLTLPIGVQTHKSKCTLSTYQCKPHSEITVFVSSLVWELEMAILQLGWTHDWLHHLIIYVLRSHLEKQLYWSFIVIYQNTQGTIWILQDLSQTAQLVYLQWSAVFSQKFPSSN